MKTNLKSHAEWRSRMDECFRYMLLHFTLNEVEEIVAARKEKVRNVIIPNPPPKDNSTIAPE